MIAHRVTAALETTGTKNEGAAITIGEEKQEAETPEEGTAKNGEETTATITTAATGIRESAQDTATTKGEPSMILQNAVIATMTPTSAAAAMARVTIGDVANPMTDEAATENGNAEAASKGGEVAETTTRVPIATGTETNFLVVIEEIERILGWTSTEDLMTVIVITSQEEAYNEKGEARTTRMTDVVTDILASAIITTAIMGAEVGTEKDACLILANKRETLDEMISRIVREALEQGTQIITLATELGIAGATTQLVVNHPSQDHESTTRRKEQVILSCSCPEREVTAVQQK